MSVPNPPPVLPSILDPLTFADRGQDFVQWEAEEFYPYLAAMAVYLPLKFSVSTSTIALTTGIKNIVIEPGKSFPVDTSIKVISTANITDYLVGTVISYDEVTGAFSFNATAAYGTGSFSSWQVIQSIPSGQLVGLLQLAKSAPIVAATTTDLEDATGNDVTITHASGDVDIESAGAATSIQAGTRIRARASIAAGTLTIVHDPVLMICEGLADIEVQDGDSWDWVKIDDALAYWRIENYTRASGEALSQSVYNENILINSGFTINQRGYVSNAVLAAGSFGHDRWKAGASGGDYTFTQLNTNTQITIKTGKTLIQVVENKNIESANMVLSWEGTAQARVGIDSATPSGSYVSSPITITTQTPGTVFSVEFNEGTLGKVKLEQGSQASDFNSRSFLQELLLCQRYYNRNAGVKIRVGQGRETTNSRNGVGYVSLPVRMYAVPTISLNNITYTGSSALSATLIGDSHFNVAYTASNLTAHVDFDYTATAEI